MKSTILLVFLALSCSVAQAQRYNVAGYRGDDNISATNYPLSQALRANHTTTGVVLDVQKVQVTSWRRGLLPLLATGLTDGLVGTHYSEVHQPALQYTVRLDTPYRRDFQIITVIQGTDVLVAVNTPVLVVTNIANHHAYQHSFRVRLSPYHNSATMSTAGVQEVAHVARELAVRNNQRR